MTLSTLVNNLSSLDEKLLSFVKVAFEENSWEVMNLQRMQLFEGKRSDGSYIKPSYSEDLQSNGGYFKTPEAAQKYAFWKATKVPIPVTTTTDQPFDTPNLYINGRFHDELGAEISDTQMEIKGMTAYAEMIVAKYGIETFGLTDESMSTLMPTIKKRVIEQLKDYLNG